MVNELVPPLKLWTLNKIMSNESNNTYILNSPLLALQKFVTAFKSFLVYWFPFLCEYCFLLICSCRSLIWFSSDPFFYDGNGSYTIFCFVLIFFVGWRLRWPVNTAKAARVCYQTYFYQTNTCITTTRGSLIYYQQQRKWQNQRKL